MQWYESDPKLLEAEKYAMNKFFPNFNLGKLEDGRLYWVGELTPGIYESKFGTPKTYTVIAVYNNNHPEYAMGASVRIYPVLPDIGEIFQEIGFKFNVLMDSSNMEYLCSIEGDKKSTGILTASYYLACAMKLFCGVDLLLTGDLTEEELKDNYWFYGR